MKGLLTLVAVALLIYALIDCARTPAAEVPLLPRVVWLMLVILLPFVGPVSWLVMSRSPDSSPLGGGNRGLGGPRSPRGGPAGRGGVAGPGGPGGPGGSGGLGGIGRPRTPRGPVGPDDDPDFLRRL